MRKRTATRKTRGTAALLGGMLCLASLTPIARACEIKIVWQADLSGIPAVAGAPAPAATAAFDFDFTHPGATVQVNSAHLTGVQGIDLHVIRSYSDRTGPTVMALYSASDGPLPGAFVRHIAPADLRPSADAKIASFADVVQAILSHRAYVTVATKAHPQGEMSGFITMHKEAIFSNDPSDKNHDPALHHAAQARLATP